MRFLFAAIALTASSFVAVDAKPVLPFRGRGCASAITDEIKELFENDFRLLRTAFKTDSASFKGEPGPANINVYFHAITKDNTPEGGNIPDEHIHQQIDVLNTAYKSTGIQFNLQKINKVRKPTWFTGVAPGK